MHDPKSLDRRFARGCSGKRCEDEGPEAGSEVRPMMISELTFPFGVIWNRKTTTILSQD